MSRRENRVEKALQQIVKAAGGTAQKHTNPGHRGDPDRLCSFPRGYHCLVETKWVDGVPPTDAQLRRHRFWRSHGMDVYVVGSPEAAQRLIDTLRMADRI